MNETVKSRLSHALPAVLLTAGLLMPLLHILEPSFLSPALIVRELKADNLEKAKKLGLMDCIECGCCAFVCPAKVNLIQRIRLGKGIVRQKMAEEKAKAAAKSDAKGGAK